MKASAHNNSKHRHHSRVPAIALVLPPDICNTSGVTHVAIAFFQSKTLSGLFITSGLSVHKLATPTMALMTSLASIRGTSLKTMMVDRRPKATTITGVSSAVPDRNDLGVEGDTQRRSESLLKKALSDSTMGACLVIQER